MNAPLKILFSLGFILFGTFTSAQTGYQETKRIQFGGVGGWDYANGDTDSRKIYIARMNRVMVVDMDTEKLIGEVNGLDGAHGIALAKDLTQGFASSGKSGEVFVFDLKTLAVIEKIKVGENPDAIVYDAFSRSIFVFNGKSKSVSIIDALSHKVTATLRLRGKPEFAASNGKGKVFVAIEDKNEIEVIDSKLYKLSGKFPTLACEEPSALAIDLKREQLILGCGNKLAAIMDANSGKISQTFKVGDGVDAAAFDAIHNRAFISAGEGKLTILSEDEKGFRFLQDVVTTPGARTLAIDQKIGTVYLPIAKFEPLAAGEKHRSITPGTFALIVVAQ